MFSIPDSLAYEDHAFMTAMQSNFGSSGIDPQEGYPPLHHHQYGYGPPPPHLHESQYQVPPGAYSPTMTGDPKDFNNLMAYHQDTWNNNPGDRQSPPTYDCYWITEKTSKGKVNSKLNWTGAHGH